MRIRVIAYVCLLVVETLKIWILYGQATLFDCFGRLHAEPWIIQRFQESLKALRDDEYNRDQYIGELSWVTIRVAESNKPGLSLRELVYEFRHQTLVLFKCALLQPKVPFLQSLLATESCG